MSFKKLLGVLMLAAVGMGTHAFAAEAHPHEGKKAASTHHAKPKKSRALHPECRKYLERRAKWYKSQGNKQELRENKKARKAFRTLPYAEQKIQCQAAYEAFDDFDHGKFRR